MTASEVTINLETDITAFANVVNGPLRTELGCFPPACTIDVVATGNTIRIVATDVAPNSRLAARAEAMDSTALGIALDAAPDIHLIRTVTVVRAAPSPPPPSPSPASEVIEGRGSQLSSDNNSTTVIAGLAGGLGALALCSAVIIFFMYRAKIKRASANLSAPVPVEMMPTTSKTSAEKTSDATQPTASEAGPSDAPEAPAVTKAEGGEIEVMVVNSA